MVGMIREVDFDFPAVVPAKFEIMGSGLKTLGEKVRAGQMLQQSSSKTLICNEAPP